MNKSLFLAMGVGLGTLAFASPALAADNMNNNGGMSDNGSMSTSDSMSDSGGMRSSENRGQGNFTMHSSVPTDGLASWYVAPMAAYTAEDDARHSGWGIGGSLRIGKNLGEHTAVELALGGSHFYENTTEWDTFSAGLHGLYYFFRGRAISPNLHMSPFLDVGASFVRSRNRDTDLPNAKYLYSNDPAFNADLGTTIRLNNYGVKLRLEGGYQWTFYSGGSTRGRYTGGNTNGGRKVFAEPQGFIGIQIPLSSQQPPPAQAKVQDHDHDGVPDDRDQCPNTASGVEVDQTGCALDSDNDNVPDAKDQCPNTPEGTQVNAKGCPVAEKDTDNDGVPDAQDQCPNTAQGMEVTRDGCTVKASKTLKEVHFALDSAKLTETSKKALDIEANNLEKAFKEHSNAHANINGYTDSTGPSAYNKKLSQKRADSVRTYLIGQGISPSRLKAQGMGESNPVATNDTKTGRLQNRRVEVEVRK